MKVTIKTKIVALLSAVALLATGCAHIATSIEHSDLQVQTNMTHSIFLNPAVKTKFKTVYIEVANTSDFQDANPNVFREILTTKFIEKGYRIVDNLEDAGYILQINVRYMDYVRYTGTKEGFLEGMLTGAGAGATLGNSKGDATALAIAGGAIGAIGGAVIGKALKVETYAGLVDLQIREKTEKPVQVTVVGNITQGSETTIQTKQEEASDRQIYKTEVRAVLKQTNLDRQKAAQVAMEKIATQIVSLF